MKQTRALSLACSLLLTAPLALAQGPGGMSPQGADGSMHMERHEGRGMGIVPHGTWWKNPSMIQALNLSTDQQKRMDDIFLQSRIQLIHMHASLEEEQLKLEPLLNANPPDQNRALAQISKIADLRADLEKTDAKMLLSLRAVLTADQWTKLQAERHMRREDREMPRGLRNFNGPGGPGRPGTQDGGPIPAPLPGPAE